MPTISLTQPRGLQAVPEDKRLFFAKALVQGLPTYGAQRLGIGQIQPGAQPVSPISQGTQLPTLQGPSSGLFSAPPDNLSAEQRAQKKAEEAKRNQLILNAAGGILANRGTSLGPQNLTLAGGGSSPSFGVGLPGTQQPGGAGGLGLTPLGSLSAGGGGGTGDILSAIGKLLGF